MCMSTPSAPAPLPERQAARAPTIDASVARSDQREAARMGFARMLLTGPSGDLSSANTTGKTLLGS